MEMGSGSTANLGISGESTDRILIVVSALLALAVLVSGVFLGYSVWRQNAIERAANPAMVVASGVAELVAANPNDPQLRVRLGEALAAAGDFRGAIQELEAALDIDPDHTGAHLTLGIIGMLQNDYEAADHYFLRVIEITEGLDYEQLKLHRQLAFFYLGESALDTNRYEEAVGYFKAALRMNRTSADSYFGLGLALKGIDELDGALENLEIALIFDPKFAQAHYEMGQVYLLKDDRINAAVHFAEAVKLDPDNDIPMQALASLGSVEEWEARAREALLTGDEEAGREAALVLRVLAPEDADLAVLHAEIVEVLLDNPDVALEIYREALELAPGSEAIEAEISRLEQ